MIGNSFNIDDAINDPKLGPQILAIGKAAKEQGKAEQQQQTANEAIQDADTKINNNNAVPVKYTAKTTPAPTPQEQETSPAPEQQTSPVLKDVQNNWRKWSYDEYWNNKDATPDKLKENGITYEEAFKMYYSDGKHKLDTLKKAYGKPINEYDLMTKDDYQKNSKASAIDGKNKGATKEEMLRLQKDPNNPSEHFNAAFNDDVKATKEEDNSIKAEEDNTKTETIKTEDNSIKAEDNPASESSGKIATELDKAKDPKTADATINNINNQLNSTLSTAISNVLNNRTLGKEATAENIDNYKENADKAKESAYANNKSILAAYNSGEIDEKTMRYYLGDEFSAALLNVAATIKGTAPVQSAWEKNQAENQNSQRILYYDNKQKVDSDIIGLAKEGADAAQTAADKLVNNSDVYDVVKKYKDKAFDLQSTLDAYSDPATAAKVKSFLTDNGGNGVLIYELINGGEKAQAVAAAISLIPEEDRKKLINGLTDLAASIGGAFADAVDSVRNFLGGDTAKDNAKYKEAQDAAASGKELTIEQKNINSEYHSNALDSQKNAAKKRKDKATDDTTKKHMSARIRAVDDMKELDLGNLTEGEVSNLLAEFELAEFEAEEGFDPQSSTRTKSKSVKDAGKDRIKVLKNTGVSKAINKRSNKK